MPGFNIPFDSEFAGDCDNPDGFKEGSAYDGPVHTVETFRKHRYKIGVLDPLFEILLYAFKCTRPAIEFDVITIHNGQDEIYRPGKNRWKEVSFTFYEVMSSSGSASASDPAGSQALATRLIYKWWSDSILDLASSALNKPADYLKPVSISMLDGLGESMWVYHLYDAWPYTVTPCDLSYTDTALSEISVTLKYDKAVEDSIA